MHEIRRGRYRHFKGNEYTVLAVALHSETMEELVVYRPEYGERALWVHPKQTLLETVKIDGRIAPRIASIGTSDGISARAIDFPQRTSSCCLLQAHLRPNRTLGIDESFPCFSHDFVDLKCL
jgi:hypothetical protein